MQKTGKIALIVLAILCFTQAQSQTPIKRPLVEEYTGTWCSSCAFGNVYFDYLETNYPNAIPVAIHSGDVMQNLDVVLYMSDYFDALPTFLYDRVDFPSNPEASPAVSAYPWPTALDTLDHYLSIQYNQTPTATVGIDQVYDPTTREITATITANFVENDAGSFRLNCFVLEDSVTGGSDYNQTNSNFSGWTGGPSFLQDLINSPSIITGYAHNHVLREMLGTPAGATASIPATVTNGSSYSKTFTYTLPVDYDETQISLVGVIQRHGSSVINDRNVVNANSQHLVTGSSSLWEFEQDFLNINVYPNPIQATSKIEFYVKENGVISGGIYNVLGEEVTSLFNQHFTQGEYKIELGQYNLSSGVYYVKFNQNEATQSIKVCVQ
jgi:thiol-disulfide isomerase/thioredoxin